MGLAAGFAEGSDLIVEGRPVAGQNMRSGDDDIYLLGAIGDRGLDLGEAGLEGRESGWEASRDSGDGYPSAVECLDRGLYVGMVDTDGPDLDPEVGDEIGRASCRERGYG